MNTPKQKRVVSKAEYAGIIARNTVLITICGVCLGIGGFFALCFFYCVLYGFAKGFGLGG